MEHRNDYTGSPGRTGGASPSGGVRGGPHPAALKRKLTLLQLIDELSALKEDEGTLHGSYEERREKDHFVEAEEYEDVSSKGGAEAFQRFDKNVSSLDQVLLNFQTAARQLGSSVGLLASAYQLRSRLHTIQTIFHENASEIFPNHVKSKVLDIEPLKPKTKRNRGEARARSNSRALLLRRSAVTTAPDPETLPAELLALAKDVKSFLTHLEEFPEFVDEALNESISAFAMDLMYRADCLSEYHEQFRWKSVQRYVHGISMEMTIHLETITRALRDFVDNGVPAIRFAQKHNGDNLLNLSTIATFFSGVTATVAQYTFDQTTTLLDKIINLLFFGSLVLSIAAAINSLLGLTWKRAMYRSPRHRVPWWVLIWIKRSPLVLMVISVGLFNTGLVCFCYATQKELVFIFVLVLTCICTVGLLAVSAWFTAERWIYSKHNGLRWLSDVIHDEWNTFIKYPPIKVMRYIPRRVSKAVKKLFGRYEESDIEDGLPFPNGDTRLSITPSPTGIRQIKLSEGGEKEYTVTDSPILSRVERVSDDDNHIPSIRSPTRLLSLASGMSSPPGTPLADEQAKSPTPMKLTGVNRFRQIAWKVAENQKEVSSIGSTGMMRSVTLLPDPTKRRDTAEGKTAELQQPKPGRLTAIRPALKKLRVTHTILDHTGLVRHLQFSPNGKILATCGWDGTARLFMVPQDRSDVERGKVMAVADGFLGQVAWSPDGNWLLTKWTTGVQLWSSEAGVRKKNIPRRRPVRSVAWFPSNKSFLSVEGSQVIQFSLDGEIEAVHELERLELYDVAITPDEERLLGVAILTRTKSGYTPRMSKIEKRVVVYNLKDRKIESLVPVLDEVRDITISRDGQLVLVSSENKDPPQLLRVDIVAGIGRLVPIRTYLPKQDVDFAGPSYFAGLQDELILVPTKSGDILFWDRESGQLLHALRNRDVGDGDLTSVAWNYASRKHMLASASHDGAIRIWMTGPSEKDLNRASSFGFGTEFEMATSPHHMSRAGTSATDNMQAFSDSFATFQGRPSRRGSVNAGSFDGHRERRRVDSPVPSEPSGDKVGGPNSVGGK